MGQGRIKGRKNWGNCNSIINKIYLKKIFLKCLGQTEQESCVALGSKEREIKV